MVSEEASYQFAGTRRGAVTETIKVIAEKMSEFQFHNLNRLKKRDRLLSKGNNNGNFGGSYPREFNYPYMAY